MGRRASVDVIAQLAAIGGIIYDAPAANLRRRLESPINSGSSTALHR
jgi:hypothetical protein